MIAGPASSRPGAKLTTDGCWPFADTRESVLFSETTTFSGFLLALVLAGCASQHDCNKTFCGCYKQHVETVTIELTDTDENPVASARLMCHDGGAYLGATNPNGILKLRVQGAISPGCGFIPECQIAFFETKDSGRGRPFWFARFVRGEQLGKTDGNVKLVDAGK